MNDTMRKSLIVLLALLCFVLGACNSVKPGSIPDDDSQVDINQTDIEDMHGTNEDSQECVLFPERDAVKELSVLIERSFSGDVYAVANGDESEAILDKLYAINFRELQDAEQTEIMGSTVSFKIGTDNNEEYVQLIATDHACFLHIRSTDQQVFKMGSKETIAYEELSLLASEVLRNTDDPDYSGRVEIVGAGLKSNVNKGNTAYAKSILDAAIAKAEATVHGAETLYDIILEIGDVLYGISSETGLFYKEEAGMKTYAQVERSLMIPLKTRIGVLGATS